jgi:uncharacterized protein with von Willebrand factor type A (vWA) domain
MVNQKEFKQLTSYIRMYVERVIGLDYPLHDSAQPRVLIDKNPEIFLPISFKSLSTFLGKEFVESADKEIIFAIVIGLAYHESAHLLSGEPKVAPHILNNLICDANDFTYVPEKWKGSIPFTITLMNVTYKQGLDLDEFELNSKQDKLQALIHLSISYLRKLRVKYDGKDIRSLPKDHCLFPVFEKIKPIVREARRAEIKDRPKLVKELYKVLKKYWDNEKKDQKNSGKSSSIKSPGMPGIGNNGAGNTAKQGNKGNGRATLKSALKSIISEMKHDLTASDVEIIHNAILNSKILRKINIELQEIINQVKHEEQVKERREEQKALSAVNDYEKNHSSPVEELTEIAEKPVEVDDSIVNSLRKHLKYLLLERAISRRKASVEGTKFSPGNFHEIKTNPEKPRIRRGIKRFGKNLVETELVLCFDRSGSMSGEKEDISQKVAGTIYKALSSIPRARIKILGFDDTVIIIVGNRKLPLDVVLRKIPTGLFARGGTSFPGGLRESLRILEKSKAHKKIIFMLTDGDLHGTPKVEELLHLSKIQNVEVFCIGVKGSSKAEIQRIFGKSNSLYVSDISSLPAEVRKIAINRL